MVRGGIKKESKSHCEDVSKPLYTSPRRSPRRMQQKKPQQKARVNPVRDIVSWTLSGEYDREKKVLIDAEDDKRFISRAKAIELVASLTNSFAADSTVCLHLPNHILYPVLCLAIYASKCRWTGTNTSYKAPELEHHFKISSTKYVVTQKRNLGTVEEAIENSRTKAEVILFGDILKKSDACCKIAENGNHRCLHDLLRDQTEEDLWSALEGIDPDSVATLGSTSGTTGKPKMAARTHRAIVQECMAMAEDPSTKPYEVRRLFCTPIFHAFSMPDMVINALRFGIPSYFMERFHGDEFPSMILKHDITETFGPPAMLLRLANKSEHSRMLQSLRMVYTGGAPFTPELRNKFSKLFVSPPVITPVWGMTECGWLTTLKWSEREVTSAVGRAPSGYEIRYGEPFDTLEGGQAVYEILVRGQSVMTEYYGNEQATKDAFQDERWLKTGDVGYEKDGMIFLVDRAKDLIKFNGWQVSPTEIGDVLLMSPDVKDAAVVGVGEGVEEHPAAFVVPAEDSPDVSCQKIRDHMLKCLAKYKVGECEVLFCSEIPKNPTGKIDRNELRRQAALNARPQKTRKRASSDAKCSKRFRGS